MDFELLGKIRDIELIAQGRRLRITGFLRQEDGGRPWRKLEGIARVRSEDGGILDAEIHWYEAHGIGRKDFKIVRLFTETE